MAPADFTLDSLIRDLLLGMGESGTHLAARLTVYGLSALDQLGYAAPASQTKRVLLEMGARREAAVPDDLLQVLRVAAQSGDYLVPLVPDERLASLDAADLAPASEEDDMFASGDVDAGNPPPAVTLLGWEFPAGWGGLWRAAWEWQAGTYRYFPRERLLRFGTGLPTHLAVELEYQPATNIGCDTPLSPLVRNALDNYCRWQYALSKGQIGQAREYEKVWLRARELWKRQHTGLHPRTVIQLRNEATDGYGGRGPYIN